MDLSSKLEVSQATEFKGGVCEVAEKLKCIRSGCAGADELLDAEEQLVKLSLLASGTKMAASSILERTISGATQLTDVTFQSHEIAAQHFAAYAVRRFLHDPLGWTEWAVQELRFLGTDWEDVPQLILQAEERSAPFGHGAAS